MSILKTKTLVGLLEDDKNINRVVAGAVSQLAAQTDLMMAMAAYLFVEAGNQNSDIELEYIADVTDRFQVQITALRGLMVKLDAIEACGNAVDGPANLQAMISTYNLDPATFTDRYK